MQTAKLSKVALCMLALAATACAPTGVTPPVATSSGQPAATATSSPAPTPSATASAAQNAPSASPTNQANAVHPKLVVLSGTVYDESGATIDNATVTVKSLDAGNPYTATVMTAQGSYVVNNVPEGVNVEIAATKSGFTSRKRVGVFQAAANQKNELNFGSPLTVTNDSGSAYFISKYPEVSSTEPAYNASNVDNASLTYKLHLSEPLDDTNRRRFEEAIRVMPANNLANPGGASVTDYTDLNDQTNDYDITTIATAGDNSGNAQARYWIKKGTLFLNDSTTRATVTWNDAGDTATLSFNAPLSTNRTDTAKYQVGLAAPAGTDKIVDKDNNQLGTDKSNSLTAYPAAGNLLRNVFVPNSLAITGNPATGADCWAATHKSVSIFSVKQDNTDPKLQSVAYTKNLGSDSRFELTFDKPMVAFNNKPMGRMDSSLTTGTVLNSLTFAISDRAGGTKNVTLKGASGVNTINPITASNVGSASTDIEKEFKLDSAAFTSTARTALTNADVGKLTIEVDPRNPKTIFIYVYGKPSLFDPKVVDLKARAEGVTDPAGNAVKSAGADATQLSGSI